MEDKGKDLKKLIRVWQNAAYNITQFLCTGKDDQGLFQARKEKILREHQGESERSQDVS